MPSGRQTYLPYARFAVKNILVHFPPTARASYFGLALLSFLVLAPAAFSQTGGIAGTVRDQRQGVLAGAKVSVRDAANRVVDTQVTKADGTYSFSSLTPGTYDIEGQAAGFKLSIAHGVRITAGETANADLLLTLEDIASSVLVEGTADEGYRVDSVTTVGPLGAKDILDTPYTFSVVPQELIQQIQPSSAEAIFETVPNLQVALPESTSLGIRINSRGYWVDTGEDGFRYTDYNFGHIDIEDKAGVELLSGLSGFLYGPMDPGGFLDYVLKRPTTRRFADLTLGDYGGTSGYFHLDSGGPIDKNERFGYRVNIVGQGLGNTPVQDQNVKRVLFSTAFDWHITHRLLFQADYSYSDYLMDGASVAWFFGPYVYTPPPDATKDWGVPFSYEWYLRNDVGAKLTYDINDHVSVRLGFKYIWDRNDGTFIGTFPNTPNDGTYTLFVNHSVGFDETTIDSYGLVDFKFKTGSVSHKVTAGFGSYRFTATSPLNGGNIFFPTNVFSVTNPASNPAQYQSVLQQLESTPLSLASPLPQGDTWAYNRFLGDEVAFNHSWSAIAGLNYATVVAQNYNFTTGAPTQYYDKAVVSPTASLIYKPTQKVSTYFTYMQGIEPGGFASSTNNGLPVTNPGAAPPTTDREYEAGVKTEVGKALLTAAFFDVTQPSNELLLNSAATAYTFESGGLEDNKGFETALTGKVTQDLSLYGGLTYVDPKITKQPSDPSLVGTRPVNVSAFMAKLYAEYNIPRLRGFTLTGGFQSYGRQPVDDPNPTNVYAPGYTIGTVGARYVTHLLDRETTFRINVLNVSNKSYWISSEELGDPRTISFSMQVRLF